MKIYTKTGDDGNTGLQGNFRVAKSHPRIMSYGTVDEANAVLGAVLSNSLDDDIDRFVTIAPAGCPKAVLRHDGLTSIGE